MPQPPNSFAERFRSFDSADVVHREFVAIKTLLSQSREFSAFYMAERGKITDLVEWLQEPNLQPGVHGGTVRQVDRPGEVTICLRQIPIPLLYAETTAHELTHCILSCKGYPEAASKVPGDSIAATLSNIVQHGQIYRRLLKYGFDVRARYDAEMDASRAVLSTYGHEPTGGETRLQWILNFAQRTIEYEAITKRGAHHSFYGFFSGRFPGVAREAAALVRLVHEHQDAATPADALAILNAIRLRYPLLQNGRVLWLPHEQALALASGAQYPAAAIAHDGVNWTEAQLRPQYDTLTSDGWLPGVWLNPLTPGNAYTNAFTVTGAPGAHDAEIFETNDYGANWSIITNPALDNGIGLGPITVPYGNGGSTVYYRHSAGTTVNRLYRTRSGATTDITPIFSGERQGPISFGRAISIADDDPNTLIMCTQGETNIFNFGVFLTHNAESSTVVWQTIVEPSASSPYFEGYAVTAQTQYLIGAGGAVAVVQNGVLDSRYGNSAASERCCALVGG